MSTPESNPEIQAIPLVGVRFESGQAVDEVLARAAEELTRRGFRVAGLVQENRQRTGDCACREMRLRDLASGRLTQISEDRGAQARGCHLDWQALTELAVKLERELSDETDVLIVNRFGRSESEGQGFRGAIEKALSLGVQVIVAYRDGYADPWEAFHGGLATPCGATVEEIVGICERNRSPATQPAS